MARYYPPPDGYDPGLTFQLRLCCEGGDLRRPLLQIPATETTRVEIVVLAHGFNNHYGEAGAAYNAFRLRQYAYDSDLIRPALEKILVDLFWPGDAAWGVADLADFLVYPAAVGTAPEAAWILADHLRAMPNLRKVHFIGHSLGCRVVLEAIRDLRVNGGPTVGKVCLMAAAVPLFKVEPDGVLADAMWNCETIRVLYSGSDWVLKVAFRTGQTVATGDEGFLPVALGADKPPPTLPGRVEAYDISGAGHGDYWGNTETNASELSSQRVGEYFRFTIWPREVGSRPVANVVEVEPRMDSAPSREIGDARRHGCGIC